MKNPITKFFIKDKYHLSGLTFDVFMDIQHNLQAQITEHPVQYGSVISDHARIQPNRLTFQVGVSDCGLHFWRTDQFSNIKTGVFDYTSEYIKDYSKYKEADGGTLAGSGIMTPLELAKMKAQSIPEQFRSKNAFKMLEMLFLARVPFDCATRLKTYRNMLIESIQAPENHQTGKTLLATINLKEIPMAMVQKVQTKSTFQSIQQTSSGSKNPIDIKVAPRELTSTDYDEYGLATT